MGVEDWIGLGVWNWMDENNKIIFTGFIFKMKIPKMVTLLLPPTLAFTSITAATSTSTNTKAKANTGKVLHERISEWINSLGPSSIPSNNGGIEWRFSRSRGPGGQNVNKVDSKVEMRIKLSDSTWIPIEIRKEIDKHKPITSTGELILRSDVHRSQEANKEDCQKKLLTFLGQIAKTVLPPSTCKEQVARVQIL